MPAAAEAARLRSERLRWRSRRALLELDLLLQRFWGRQAQVLDAESAAALEQLLEMEDHDLWRLLGGEQRLANAALQHMVDRLRAPADANSET